MSEHTPGPWLTQVALHPHDPREAGDTGIVAIENGEKFPIGEIWALLPDGRGLPVSDNARLIAAAPDLLAACKAAFQGIGAPINTITAQHNYQQLSAAIERAEGTIPLRAL